MSALTEQDRAEVASVIAENIDTLAAIPNFVTAEPGFAIVDGAIVKEPAIVVFVSRVLAPTELLEEERAPSQLGPYRVAVMQADPLRQLAVGRERLDLPEFTPLEAAALTYQPIDGDPINEVFEVEEPLLCHVGPDAGWRTVLKPFIEETQRSLTVAMYDYNADYIAKTFIETVRANNVNVTMTLDDSLAQDEKDIWAKHGTKLGDAFDGWIVRCSPNRRFESAYHPKVAVRDSRSFWLSSGNWSRNSQADNDPIGDESARTGMYKKNREWHVIVDHEGLAQLFEQYITHDRDGSEAEETLEAAFLDKVAYPDLFVEIDELADVSLLAEEEEIGPFDAGAVADPWAGIRDRAGVDAGQLHRQGARADQGRGAIGAHAVQLHQLQRRGRRRTVYRSPQHVGRAEQHSRLRDEDHRGESRHGDHPGARSGEQGRLQRPHRCSRANRVFTTRASSSTGGRCW